MSASSASSPRVTVLYHYMRPDDVVSARHFDGLCEGLAARGYRVTAMPSNRACREDGGAFALRESFGAVDYRRVWRPDFRQASGKGRLANAAWMLASWAAKASLHDADAVIVGTDPILSVAVAPVLKALRPSLRVAHWAYDLYPEAAVADGMLDGEAPVTRALGAIAAKSYAACDLVVDIGGCMRDRLRAHGHGAREATLTPWALSEPAEPLPPPPATRRELFGDAALGVLYSGTFGRAHAYERLLDLARRLRGESIRFCFAARGNRVDELRRAVGPDDTNVGFAGFCSEAELERRLASADVHAASLREAWSGVVVPSKFFGSLAAGRPVLFDGPRSSALARWIDEHEVGWVLASDRLDAVAASMRSLARDPAARGALSQRCHAVYHERFSQRRVLDAWDRELRAIL